MKNLALLITILAISTLSSCGGSSDKKEVSQKGIKKEVQQLDSLSNSIDATNIEIDNAEKALEEALEELETTKQ